MLTKEVFVFGPDEQTAAFQTYPRGSKRLAMGSSLETSGWRASHLRSCSRAFVSNSSEGRTDGVFSSGATLRTNGDEAGRETAEATDEGSGCRCKYWSLLSAGCSARGIGRSDLGF